MATNDFILDLTDKLKEDGVEYLVIAVQKGDKKHSSNAYYNIVTDDGLEMVLTTIDEVFSDMADGEMDIDPDDPRWNDDPQ